MLAGGALRACFDNTGIKDYDLFFRDEQDYLNANDILSSDPDFHFKGANGRTETFVHLPSGREFNLVGIAFLTAAETIERFDFRCCRMAAWMVGDDVYMVADPNASTDATEKRLVVLVCNGEERTERRIQHYVEDYGYTLDLSVTDHLNTAQETEEDLTPPRPVAAEQVRRYIRRLPTSCGGY
jgi:hypothetical protein